MFFKSNQCLRKPLFRKLIHTSANCLGCISGCLVINFCEIQGFQGWFYLIFGIFHGLKKSHRKEFFRVFRVLGKVSQEIQGFQAPLNSFQDFQDPLDTLHLQDKLVLCFHSKSSILWLTLIPWHWFWHLLVPASWIFKLR